MERGTPVGEAEDFGDGFVGEGEFPAPSNLPPEFHHLPGLFQVKGLKPGYAQPVFQGAQAVELGLQLRLGEEHHLNQKVCIGAEIEKMLNEQEHIPGHILSFIHQ